MVLCAYARHFCYSTRNASELLELRTRYERTNGMRSTRVPMYPREKPFAGGRSYEFLQKPVAAGSSPTSAAGRGHGERPKAGGGGAWRQHSWVTESLWARATHSVTFRH